MKKRHVAVLGAGPAGLTAAYLLAQDPSIEVSLYEADSYVGGMSRSFDLWGQRVDMGPHRFFSNHPGVNALWLQMLEDRYSFVNRLTRIYYDGKFFYYPLKAVNALLTLGFWEALRCTLSYLKEKFTPRSRNPQTFEDWVVSRFGQRLFEIFFKSYSEKLWGISCKNLDADFAAQRIKKFSFMEALKGALRFRRDTRHRTLVDQFAYPHRGAGEVYEKMAEKFCGAGGHLYLSKPVKGLWIEESQLRGIELMSGEKLPFDEVISSMPLTKLVQAIPGTPTEVQVACQNLRFRNTVLVYLEVSGTGLFDDQWIYVHDPRFRVGRITNFRNWVPQICGESQNTILVLESWCYGTDPEWTWEDSIWITLAQKEIEASGLTRGSKVLQGKVLRIPRCYPVYHRGYKEHLSVLRDYLLRIPKLQVIGRYGAFKYNNQDHSILMGMLAAENILRNAGHDLWGVNTDDDYQEAASVSSTGLAR